MVDIYTVCIVFCGLYGHSVLAEFFKCEKDAEYSKNFESMVLEGTKTFISSPPIEMKNEHISL